MNQSQNPLRLFVLSALFAASTAAGIQFHSQALQGTISEWNSSNVPMMPPMDTLIAPTNVLPTPTPAALPTFPVTTLTPAPPATTPAAATVNASQPAHATIECNDQDDNDGDGMIDINDADCRQCMIPVEDCPDGMEIPVIAMNDCFDQDDNDGDGLIDANDTGCFANSCGWELCAINPAAPPNECADNDDNDNDGLIDGSDPECASCNTGIACSEAGGPLVPPVITADSALIQENQRLNAQVAQLQMENSSLRIQIMGMGLTPSTSPSVPAVTAPPCDTTFQAAAPDSAANFTVSPMSIRDRLYLMLFH